MIWSNVPFWIQPIESIPKVTGPSIMDHHSVSYLLLNQPNKATQNDLGGLVASVKLIATLSYFALSLLYNPHQEPLL